MCGMVLGLVGGMFSAMGALTAGRGQQAQYEAQAASLKAQAAFNRRQADAETIKGSTQILQQRRNVERIVGGQTAGYGAAGLQVDTGTPVETQMATNTEAEMDRQAIRFGRDITASNYQYQAKIDLMNAEAAHRAGQYAMKAAKFQAGTALISSFSSMIPSFPTA